MTGHDCSESVTVHLADDDLAVLRVCVAYRGAKFAGAWIKRECERLGVPFHQARLGRLARLGLLAKEDDARGGHRRYYRIGDCVLVERILSESR
jgi:hypothetical protein